MSVLETIIVTPKSLQPKFGSVGIDDNVMKMAALHWTRALALFNSSRNVMTPALANTILAWVVTQSSICICIDRVVTCAEKAQAVTIQRKSCISFQTYVECYIDTNEYLQNAINNPEAEECIVMSYDELHNLPNKRI